MTVRILQLDSTSTSTPMINGKAARRLDPIYRLALRLKRMRGDKVVRRFTLFYMRTRKALSCSLVIILSWRSNLLTLLSVPSVPDRSRPITWIMDPYQNLGMLQYQRGHRSTRKAHPQPVGEQAAAKRQPGPSALFVENSQLTAGQGCNCTHISGDGAFVPPHYMDLHYQEASFCNR